MLLQDHIGLQHVQVTIRYLLLTMQKVYFDAYLRVYTGTNLITRLVVSATGWSLDDCGHTRLPTIALPDTLFFCAAHFR